MPLRRRRGAHGRWVPMRVPKRVQRRPYRGGQRQFKGVYAINDPDDLEAEEDAEDEELLIPNEIPDGEECDELYYMDCDDEDDSTTQYYVAMLDGEAESENCYA